MLASDVLHTRSHAWLKWTICGVLACSLHVAILAWAAYRQLVDDTENEVAGAIAMELSPVLAQQRIEAPEAALGPQSDDAVPTPPTTEKVEELKPLDVPQFEQSPLAPEPEVALPIAKPIKDPNTKQEELKEVQPENLAPQQTASSAAMAPPQIPVTERNIRSASQIGEARKNSQAILTYQKAIRLHVKKHQSYSREARVRELQGSAVVEFAIDRTGKLIDRELRASSGTAVLDEDALSTVERSSPFPLPPDDAVGEVLRFSLKIEFKIK
jgi:periplasmic protein TonB